MGSNKYEINENIYCCYYLLRVLNHAINIRIILKILKI